MNIKIAISIEIPYTYSEKTRMANTKCYIVKTEPNVGHREATVGV